LPNFDTRYEVLAEISEKVIAPTRAWS